MNFQLCQYIMHVSAPFILLRGEKTHLRQHDDKTLLCSQNCKFLLQKTRNDWHITLFSIWHGPQLSYLDGEELRKQEENNPNTNIE